MSTILVVDDEKSMREFLRIMLEGEGYAVKDAATGAVAVHLLQKEEFDLIISDIKMPGLDGIDVLSESKKLQPNSPVVMLTAYATPETAVEVMKMGAYDYLSKPFRVEQVKLVIRKAIERKHLLYENLILKQDLKSQNQFEGIVGKSKNIRDLFTLIEKVADTQSNILLLGESGTGKELVAKAIHNRSKRKDKPFVTVNCAAIPDHLLESELFGHVKGAFTSADSDKKGLFEVADQGTFLLDEISELPLSIQAKLLRVLQEKEFKRVGGIKNVKIDVRVIAATNKDLREAIREKSFREDLFFRLDVISLTVPPLRQRQCDISVLSEYFIKKHNIINSKEIHGLAPETLDLLERYQWPGNVRELENVIERSVVFADEDKIFPQHLPDTLRQQNGKKRMLPPDIDSGYFNLEKYIGVVEREILVEALQKVGWKKKKAANLLNMSFRSFRYKLQKHDIDKEREEN